MTADRNLSIASNTIYYYVHVTVFWSLSSLKLEFVFYLTTRQHDNVCHTSLHKRQHRIIWVYFLNVATNDINHWKYWSPRAHLCMKPQWLERFVMFDILCDRWQTCTDSPARLQSGYRNVSYVTSQYWHWRLVASPDRHRLPNFRAQWYQN